MKIYTQINGDEVSALSSLEGHTRRWTKNAGDIGVGSAMVSATVADNQVDYIRSRQAREDGGWSKEVCLFPGVKLTDLEVG